MTLHAGMTSEGRARLRADTKHAERLRRWYSATAITRKLSVWHLCRAHLSHADPCEQPQSLTCRR